MCFIEQSNQSKLVNYYCLMTCLILWMLNMKQSGRDLDLLRDATLTCDEESQRWKCRHCGNRINTEEVENRYKQLAFFVRIRFISTFHLHLLYVLWILRIHKLVVLDCNHAYWNVFSYRLLEATDKLNAAYLLQDFRCKSSHRVARRLGTAVSELCVPLVMDTSRSDALDKLRVLRQVAQFHKFSFLQAAVEELMV